VVMVGGHGELFWAIYEPGSSEGQASIRSTPIAELAAILDHTIVYGTGAETLVNARGGRGNAVMLLPDARSIGLLAEPLRTLPPRPNYGRGADAKPMVPAG